MTIGYNKLGSNGGLGNQMFQYAALRGIAENRGFDWVVPKPIGYGSCNYGLFECFEMCGVSKNNFGTVDGQELVTGTSAFDKTFFNECPDNVSLNDYFQSEKYFKNVEDDIRKDFTFRSEILNPCLDFIKNISDPIFLHVRRNDYLYMKDNYVICPISYYEESLSYFSDESDVLIFSDDIEWCKEQSLFSGKRFFISENQSYYLNETKAANGMTKWLIPYNDLCLMTLCSGGIIANSSLSWWGAWLIKNPNKIVVSPKDWFGPSSSHLDTKDLYCENWIRI